MMYNNAILGIIGVDRMNWKGGKFDIKARSFSALAFRIYGNATITTLKKSYVVNENTLLYLPQSISYKAEYTDTEIIVIHFIALNNDTEPCVFEIGERNYIYKLFSEALNKYKAQTYKFSIMSLIYKILADVCESGTLSELPPCLNKAILFINSNYKKAISIDKICENSGRISATYLRILFKKYFFKTPIEYVNSLRLENAKKLIINGTRVEEAAFESGFNDSKYFSRLVKKQFGCTPRELKDLGK